MAAAVVIAVLPPTSSCGSPIVAVQREDRSESLDGLSRLGAGPGPAPRAEDLDRLAELENDVAWYRACHHPAVRRMTTANVAAAMAVAVVVALLARRARSAGSIGQPVTS
jgi:hypothetical protein